MPIKNFMIYSHGFGVDKTDRGLFSDIIAKIPNVEHIMFDYNKINIKENKMYVNSFTKQSLKLKIILKEIKEKYPNSRINLICHSQGCIVAAILNPTLVDKTIFLAPPDKINVEQVVSLFNKKHNASINFAGNSHFIRQDGSITVVQKQYWKDIKNLDLLSLYNEMSNLTIIKAELDDVLGETDFTSLNKTINIITLNANHNFSQPCRQQVITIIDDLVKQKTY